MDEGSFFEDERNNLNFWINNIRILLENLNSINNKLISIRLNILQGFFNLVGDINLERKPMG